MGVAGMILGIIGVVFAFIPLVGPFIAFPCIAVGMPLSIIGFVRNRRRGQGKGMAIAGDGLQRRCAPDDDYLCSYHGSGSQ